MTEKLIVRATETVNIPTVEKVEVVNIEKAEVIEPNTETIQVVLGESPSADHKSKVSSNDNTADFLETKIVAGTGVGITVLNEGGDEQLQISSSVIDQDKNVAITDNDTTPGVLNTKLLTDSTITKTVGVPGGDETLTLSVDQSEISHLNIQDTGINTHAEIDIDLTRLENTSGTNTGDQTSISGITGNKAEFDVALTDGDFLYVGDIDLSPYWKSDGSSTATGDWDLGSYNLSFDADSQIQFKDSNNFISFDSDNGWLGMMSDSGIALLVNGETGISFDSSGELYLFGKTFIDNIEIDGNTLFDGGNVTFGNGNQIILDNAGVNSNETELNFNENTINIDTSVLTFSGESYLDFDDSRLITGQVIVIHDKQQKGFNPTADTNEARGYALKLAQADAISGDLIYVRPGNYDCTDLWDKNINYYFAPGAIIENTGTHSANGFGAIFRDRGQPYYLNVSGMGVFINHETNSTLGNYELLYPQGTGRVSMVFDYAQTYKRVIDFTGSVGSSVWIKANKLESTNSICLDGTGSASVYIDVKEIISDTASAFDFSGSHDGFFKFFNTNFTSPNSNYGDSAMRMYFYNCVFDSGNDLIVSDETDYDEYYNCTFKTTNADCFESNVKLFNSRRYDGTPINTSYHGNSIKYYGAYFNKSNSNQPTTLVDGFGLDLNGGNFIFDSQTLSSISTGTSDNDKLVTQGYIDDTNALLVPYTGAINDVDLGNYDLTSSDLNLTSTTPSILFTDTYYTGHSGLFFFDSPNTVNDRFRFHFGATPGDYPALFIQKQDIKGIDDLLFLGYGHSANSNFIFENYKGDDFYIQTRNPLGNGDIYFATGVYGNSNLTNDRLKIEASTGNIILLEDNQELLFGAGQDAGIYYDGNNLHIDAQLVGSGTIILDNLPTSSSGLPTGAVWNNGGVLNIV